MKKAERDLALRALHAADWLARYPAAIAEALLDHGRLVRLEAGQWAQAEGDERSGLFILIDGTFHSYCQAPGDREVMIGVTGAGSILGHATRFSGGPRLVTAVCAEPSLVLEVSERALDEIAAAWPQIWRAIAESSYAGLRRAIGFAVEAIALPPRQRLASRLLAAATRRPAETAPVVRLSQQMLAETVGLTRKTVNQYLAAFEADGLVQVGYGAVTLLDPEGLRRVANS
jgi:CRP-like cAMP-binding protein